MMSSDRPSFSSSMSLPLRRWIFMWNTISYMALAISSGVALADPGLSLPMKGLCVGYTAGWAAWYWAFVVRAGDWRSRPRIHGISTVVSILTLAGMSWIHPAYLYLLLGFSGVAFSVLSLTWASVVSVEIFMGAALRIVMLNGGFQKASISTFLIFAMSAGMSILLGLFIHAIIRQSHERQQMIEDLQAARSELAQVERQGGVMEERQRLAAVIHDTLAQGLTSIIMHLEAGESFFETDPVRARQHLDQARAAARASLDEARRFVWATQPDIPGHEPLSKALERLVERWIRETNTPATLRVEGQPRTLPAAYEITLLRAAQEGLANVRKHACASQVNLTLTYMEDEVFLDVQDNGQGFDPAQTVGSNLEGGGFGLFSLRERARQMAGSLAIESIAHEGTTLTLQLPLTENTSDSQENPK